MRRAALAAGAASALGAAAVVAVALRRRPRHSRDVAHFEAAAAGDAGASPEPPPGGLEAALYAAGRRAVLSGVTAVARAATAAGGGTWETLGAARLARFVDAPRAGGVPLLTVSNHSSVADDPGLMSLLAPASATAHPERMRWAVCTEEICFDDARVGAFAGLGKAVAIRRGGSIYQPGLAALARRLDEGAWVHVFPEGRCWQEGGTPRRDAAGRWCTAGGRCGAERARVGPFKWGVGKLIANAAVVPVVVPLFHAGMWDVAPQGPNNLVLRGGYRVGRDARVTTLVGEPVDVAGILERWHAAAAARAARRNEERADALARARGGLAAWAAWARGVARGAARAAAGWPPRTPPPAPAAAGAPPPPPPSLSLAARRPINTDEDASDHSGASARLARVPGVRDVPPGVAAAAVREAAGDAAGRYSSEARAALPCAAAAAAEEAVRDALAATQRLADAAATRGAALAAAAEDLAARLREALGARGGGDGGGGSSAPPAPPAPARPRSTPSVSTPAPAPLARGAPARTVTLVPTRTLATGVVVPAYVEPPLRAAPPDAAALTPAQAAEEEEHRLALYAELAAACERAVVALEREVMAYRAAQGVVERPLE